MSLQFASAWRWPCPGSVHARLWSDRQENAAKPWAE